MFRRGFLDELQGSRRTHRLGKIDTLVIVYDRILMIAEHWSQRQDSQYSNLYHLRRHGSRYHLCLVAIGNVVLPSVVPEEGRGMASG